jgi:adenine-specific DNA-methyltransferase
MEKIDVTTTDITQENVERLAELFPSVATEVTDDEGNVHAAIDFDALRDLLGDVAEGQRERYQFTWPGKRKAKEEARRPTTKAMRPEMGKSVNWDTTQNLYIEGDNLEALRIMRNTYAAQIKLIYIDPPYNTGYDFIYDDDFAQTHAAYDTLSGDYDEDGGRLVSNPDSNGRFHSDWCSMIYSRLLIARDLLSKDGAIFISISDAELDNLKKICDEVFGATNYINTVSVLAKNTAGASGGGEDKRLKKNIEYLLIYAKDYLYLPPFKSVFEKREISELVDEYVEQGKSWKYTSVLIDPGVKEYCCSTVDGEGNEIKIYTRQNPIIKSVSQLARESGLDEADIYHSYGPKIFQTTNAQSSIRTRVMAARQEHGIIEDLISIEYVPRSGKRKGNVYEQFYKGEQARLFVWLADTAEEIDGVLYKLERRGTFWDFVGETKNLTKEGGVAFPNGKKPVKLIETIIEMQLSNDDIVLDFFSGSATTAHAVFNKALDGLSCHFILVQLPENLDRQSLDANDGDYFNICDIGEERIRRAGKKIVEEVEEANRQLKLGEDPKPIPDVGFRVLRIDSSNFSETYLTPDDYAQATLDLYEDNVKPGRSGLDLLFQVLPTLRIPYSARIDETDICGKKVFIVNGGRAPKLVACFDTEVNKECIEKIAKMRPIYAVFRDASMADDATAANFEELFKTFSPDTERKVI